LVFNFSFFFVRFSFGPHAFSIAVKCESVPLFFRSVLLISHLVYPFGFTWLSLLLFHFFCCLLAAFYVRLHLFSICWLTSHLFSILALLILHSPCVPFSQLWVFEFISW
jgi:hypothetical protein